MGTKSSECRASVLECGSPLPLWVRSARFEGGRGLPHSKTLARLSCTPGDPWARGNRKWPVLGKKPPAVACLLLILLVPLRGLAAADLPPAVSRLPRTNLLVFHDRTGAIVPVKSKADWQKRRAEIVRGMAEVMGPLPGREKRCPLDLRIEQETDCGSYVRRSITYATEPGSRVPAYLLIPKAALPSKRKFPAVLALHPTDMQYGHRVTAEQLRANYRAYGRDLAERGYVVLAPAYPIMAGYQPDLKMLGYQSGTMKAIWDNIRGVDLLESLPFVRKGKVAAIGHSLGGHNAIYTAVFDPRIQAVVSSSGFDSFLDYYGGDPANWQPERGWCQTRYMPRLADYRGRLAEIPFDFHELIGALAPRPVFVNAPLRDANFRWQSVDQVLDAAAAVYRLYRVPQNIQVAHPDCEHDFPPEVRDAAYQFLDQCLR
jgi:dienelactone hydrolase